MKYNKNLFLTGDNTIIADKLEPGMFIWLSEDELFYIDDIDKFFINDKISKLYGDHDEVLPKHTKITLYNERDEEITDIPGTANVIAYDFEEHERIFRYIKYLQDKFDIFNIHYNKYDRWCEVNDKN